MRIEMNEIFSKWNDKLDFELIGSNAPTTLIIKFGFNDYSSGKELLTRIRHLSRYMSLTYHQGMKTNGYIIQFDYDLYHNENLDKLFMYIYSFLIQIENSQVSA